MSTIRINGIRVGHQMFHLRQYPSPQDSEPREVLYRTLAGKGINLPCLGVEGNLDGYALSCCLEEDLSQYHPAQDDLNPGDLDFQSVCMISVYPHGSKTEILGYLLSLFGRHGIPFFHMVSSNAMISFVISQTDKAGALALLEQTFDLPPTHTPYEPGFHEETAAFVKKRYQETRAYFQEKKIKTYGFALEKGVELTSVNCKLDGLERAGRAIQALDAKFYFATALGHARDNTISLHWLGEISRGDSLKEIHPARETADLVSFHGPHFGDRFGIFNAAAACLETAGLHFTLAGCTGASISLVFPAGQGEAALPALEKGFEAP